MGVSFDARVIELGAFDAVLCNYGAEMEIDSLDEIQINKKKI